MGEKWGQTTVYVHVKFNAKKKTVVCPRLSAIVL